MMNQEIDRIINLFTHIDEVEIVDNIEVQSVGFKDIEDYTFIKFVQEKFNNFMQYVEEWDNLEDRIPTIQRTFVLVQLLKRDDVKNV